MCLGANSIPTPVAVVAGAPEGVSASIACWLATGAVVAACGAAALNWLIPDPVPGVDELILTQVCLNAIRKAIEVCRRTVAVNNKTVPLPSEAIGLTTRWA